LEEVDDVHNTRYIREKGFEALTREPGPVGTVYWNAQGSIPRPSGRFSKNTKLANVSGIENFLSNDKFSRGRHYISSGIIARSRSI